ncbi:P-loop containing nucleoside triphosphate hydrolase protein [Lophiostoma macrostomum CBS 122681]|uniref:Structural maintenance of chromosomes protein 5 n=1 Tax=Lophiostoma macrostomum CBS 122681 TaxID=1314788 RepID=A0A6A6T6Y5_9PLEO|nr:P-loop containing nucleoside triphosphate hydrolase protein [Lophiostoma macrostomum CBS 122681]
MPGLKRLSVALSEDDELSDAPSQSSLGSKRARYDGNARDESSGSVRLPNGSHTSRAVQNGHSPEDEEFVEEPHKPGSIVRVKLKNFVTYTAAEFHPGPSLNMVIGPNGTGKSTLVCAICLGLGWDPKNLGRAKDIGEFVKHGSNEAEIAIELAAGPQHGENPVIYRKITKQGNKSKFEINGQSATQKKVVKLAKEFSIQIDNLCQFLPQDRVVEFSQLTPVALLRETLRAAAPEHMVVWHEQLKDFRSEEKRLEIEHTKEDAHLRQLQTKQNATREDVERHNEREKHVKRFNALKRSRPIIESNMIKKQLAVVGEERDKAKLELDQLKAEVAPIRIAQEASRSYCDQVRVIRDQREAHVGSATTQVHKLMADFKAGQDTITDFSTRIEAEKTGEKQRRQDVKRLEGVIASYDRAMQERPVEVDEAAFIEQRKQFRAIMSVSERRDPELLEEMTNCIAQANDIKQVIQNQENSRKNLETQSGQQANLLQRVSSDTARGWNWIQKNLHTLKLQGEVHGPPILTCSVENPRFAAIVENHLRPGDTTAITCTNGQDAQLISKKLLGPEMGLHHVSIRTVPRGLAYYRNPLTREELRELGFEGWALDYIQGPDPVLAMLCDGAGLHRAAYAPNQLSEEQHKAVEQSPIATWIAGRHKYRVTRRKEYGQTSTRVVPLVKAKYFTDQPVDMQKRHELDEAIQDSKTKLAEAQKRHAQAKDEQQEEKLKHAEAKGEIENITKEHNQKKKARVEWDALPNKKAEKQSELDILLDIMRQTGNRVLDIKTKLEKTAHKLASIMAVDLNKAFSILRQADENLAEAEFRLIEAESEVESLEAENANIGRALTAKEELVKQLNAQKKSLRDQHNKIARNLNGIMETLSEEERTIMAEASELPTIEDLENEIAAVQSRLELMAEGNPNAIRAYENREREIEGTQKKLEEIAEEQEKTKDQIKEIREQWEPQLDGLVRKISDGFSHNFAQINCAGQVSVLKDENFENWSIQIEVKFREHEQLSVLNSQRQSGGERAVSTIFYLMALQDLARSPFRVVDEINQGMDPRNERMVHERMVDIACRERTSQYFLITPKLLNDLKFHPKMKIHCIASGEHMPKDHHELDFKKLADEAIRTRLGTAAA